MVIEEIRIPVKESQNFPEVKAFIDQFSNPKITYKPKFFTEKLQHDYETWLDSLSIF